MSLELAEIEIVEIAPPHEDPLMTAMVAQFITDELYGGREPDTRLPKTLKSMGERMTLAAFDQGCLLVATGALRIGAGRKKTRLEDLVVDDDYARIGLGSTLVGLLEERARQAGAPSLYLNSAQTAQGFYEKLGYEPSIGQGPSYARQLL